MDILHPLHDILEYREAGERLLIKVLPDADKKALLGKIQDSFKTNMVMNADVKALRKALMEATGEFVDAGAALEKYREECDTYITLKTGSLSCTLTVKQDLLDLGIKPTKMLIMFRLSRAKVTFGIDEAAVVSIVDNELWETPTGVAEGVKPTRGLNGTIEYKVSAEAVYVPKITKDGSADFRDIQSFTQVNTGDLIAVRVPEGKGTPGTSIFGAALPAEPGTPYELKASNNIIVTGDKNELRAETNGLIVKNDGIIAIKNDLEIPGDVDFKVGNISFKGKVIINGNVLPGFTIESESDILIHGQVEASTVKSSGGSVQIEKGVIGKDSTYIFAKEQVIINFAQDAVIESEGTVVIETSLLHSNVKCENFKTSGGRATVIGGSITAYNSIYLASCGNTEETITNLIVRDRKVVEMIEKRKQLAGVLEQINHLYIPAEREVRNKSKMIKHAGEFASPKHIAELEQSTKRFQGIKTKAELVEKSIATIDIELKRDDILEGDISISGDIFPGTNLELHKKKQTFDRKNHALCFTLDNGDLKNTPINNDGK